LHGLKCGILLAEGFLNEIAVFKAYSTEFEMRSSNDFSDVNMIIWLKKFEMSLSNHFFKSKEK
jgi:hypothetical protein